MSQLKESELRLIDVHKRISEIEHIFKFKSDIVKGERVNDYRE